MQSGPVLNQKLVPSAGSCDPSFSLLAKVFKIVARIFTCIKSIFPCCFSIQPNDVELLPPVSQGSSSAGKTKKRKTLSISISPPQGIRNAKGTASNQENPRLLTPPQSPVKGLASSLPPENSADKDYISRSIKRGREVCKMIDTNLQKIFEILDEKSTNRITILSMKKEIEAEVTLFKNLDASYQKFFQQLSEKNRKEFQFNIDELVESLYKKAKALEAIYSKCEEQASASRFPTLQELKNRWNAERLFL